MKRIQIIEKDFVVLALVLVLNGASISSISRKLVRTQPPYIAILNDEGMNVKTADGTELVKWRAIKGRLNELHTVDNNKRIYGPMRERE